MQRPFNRQVTLVMAVALAVGGSARADTLVLRDGDRVEGQLIGVRGSSIEFEKRYGRRVERYDRRDVRRIEIEDDRYGDDRYGHDRPRDDGHQGGSSGGEFGGRPSGLRERSVSVSAASGWVDTGVTLRRGQSVYFSASGKVRWGKDRNDGPDGERNSPHNPGRPIPDRPGAALIGRIDNGDPFLIGSQDGPIRVRDGGSLKLGINDDYLLDNGGAFRVTIYY